MAGVRAAIGTETAWAPAVEPAPCDAVFVPYAVDVPNSKYQLVEWPAGLTVPVKVADVPVTAVGAPV